MKSVSSFLRTNLVPPRLVWLAEGIGAVVAASVAFACPPDLWLLGLTAAWVAFALTLSAFAKLTEQVQQRRASHRP